MGKSSKKSRASRQSRQPRQPRQSKTKKTSGTINKHKAPPIKAISNPKITNPKILEQYNNLSNAINFKNNQNIKKRIQQEASEAERREKSTQLSGCIIC